MHLVNEFCFKYTSICFQHLYRDCTCLCNVHLTHVIYIGKCMFESRWYVHEYDYKIQMHQRLKKKS